MHTSDDCRRHRSMTSATISEDKTASAVKSLDRSDLCKSLTMISTPVYIAVMLFAMSTWLSVVGMWVEMPLLVNAQPEAWNLPAYLVIIIQCANLGPAVYTMVNRIRKNHRNMSVQQQQERRSGCGIDSEIFTSLIIIVIAILSTLLLSIFWDQTVVVGGSDWSIPLLVLVCFASLSCCTSSVVFLPYMARFPSVYISAYYFGQGLCGLIPGVAGLIQGAGQNPQCRNETDIFNTTLYTNMSDLSPSHVPVYKPPRFSVSTFFGFIAVMLCGSCVAFCCLNYVHVCRAKMIITAESHCETATEELTTGGGRGTDEREVHEVTGLLDSAARPSGTKQNDDILIQPVVESRRVMRRYRYITLLVIIGIVSALWNGVLPATQTYSCLPYGNIVYKLSICLSWVVSPLATLPNMFMPTSSLSLVSGLAGLAGLLSALHLVLAAQSPYPWLHDAVSGQVIVVVTSIVMAFCFSFVRVSVSSILRREGGRMELLWCGGVTQFGSLCGALVSFILVSVLHTFHRLRPCTV